MGVSDLRDEIQGKTARRISMLKPPCPIIAAAETEELTLF